ncbi:MAG: shikimate kinase [Eggerthellaceae bacterium]|nr:shikimate kinase [Eggerthellaceae bacterium]
MTKTTSNVIMIGMPGAGKSTLGVVLAKIMNKGFIDCDLVIQGECGKTLQDIIDEEGPEGFIAVENRILSGIHPENTVISTGGSAVYSDEAMAHLASLGPIVYLEISYESLVQRLSDLHERGVLLKNGVSMSLRDLYEERKPLYEQYADITVNVDDLSITAAARKVASAICATKI